MSKYIFLVKRKAGLTREEFSHYWREVHGPLAMGIPEFHRHFVSYVQNHLVDTAAADDGFDGIAELTYASSNGPAVIASDPIYRERIAPDEERFLDLQQTVTYAVDEVRLK